MPHSVFLRRSAMPASAADLYAWHARPGAFQRLQPPWERNRVTASEGTFGTEPYRLTVRTSLLGPIRGTMRVEVYDFRPGEGFQDRQIRGPFAAWNHTHSLIADGPDLSILEDRIDYRLPLGMIGAALAGEQVRRRLETMFAYRQALTASDLRRHLPYANRPRLKLIVTGSHGMVGSELVPFLTTGGHSVTRLVSGKAKPSPFEDGTRSVSWNPQTPLDPAVLDGCDAVIHLAGDGIAEGRWTDAKRKRIRESRTIPTRHLANAIAALPPSQRPRAFLSASAIGISGDSGDAIRTEHSPPGSGFLADVCKEWEAATEPAAAAGVRVVNLRFGSVLTPKGGALGKQLPAFRAGLGAVLGSGRQWVSWVTVHDAVGAIHYALMTDTLNGPVNVTAPNPVTNREFTKTLGRVLNRPAALWLPRTALRAMFGGIADAALLASLRVEPERLSAAGFAFDHAELEPGLRFLLGR